MIWEFQVTGDSDYKNEFLINLQRLSSHYVLIVAFCGATAHVLKYCYTKTDLPFLRPLCNSVDVFFFYRLWEYIFELYCKHWTFIIKKHCIHPWSLWYSTRYWKQLRILAIMQHLSFFCRWASLLSTTSGLFLSLPSTTCSWDVCVPYCQLHSGTEGKSDR